MALSFTNPNTPEQKAAQAVIDYWFDDVGADGWFAKDDDRDGEIRRRFGELRERLLDTKAAGWRDGPRRLLAAVIVLDQFSRNIFRGQAEAFAADKLARRLTRRALAKGWDKRMEDAHRRFLYMPLMHSEDLGDQDESVALFDALAEDERDKFAHLHRDQIERFGRFPGRNAALGRVSTPEEKQALDDGAAF